MQGGQRCCNWDANATTNTDASSGNKTTSPKSVTLPNPIGKTSITAIIGTTLSYAIGLMGSLALMVFLYGGFMWVTSAGSGDKVKAGVDAMLYAAVGILVVFASYGIIKAVIKALEGAGSFK
jgi:hypothetical protein